jgi:hypothetical protein
VHLGPGQRRQHGQAAVAGAQVEHARACGRPARGRCCRRPAVRRSAARHDGALVHVEGHALQPGLARSGRRRACGCDALVHQRLTRDCSARGSSADSATASRRPAAGPGATAPARRLRRRRWWCRGPKETPASVRRALSGRRCSSRRELMPRPGVEVLRVRR